MASEAELIEAIRNAGRAGDGEAVRALGRQLERQRSQSQPRPVNPVVNTAAGLAQGVAALPDMVTEGIAGLGRMVNAPVARAASGFYRAVGMDDAANRVDRNRQTFDRAWSQPATFGRAIESLAPTPQDGAGKAVRFASQIVGGMAIPFGKAPATPPRLPRPTPPNPVRGKPGPNMRVVEAGRRQNIPVRKPDAIPAARGDMAAAEASRYGGPRIAVAREGDQAAIQARLGQIGGGGNVQSEAYNMGTQIRQAGEDYIKRTGKAFGRQYDKVDDLARGQRVNPQNAIAEIDFNLSQLRSAGENSNRSLINYLEGLKADLSKPGGFSVGDFRSLRTSARNTIKGDQALTATDADRRLGDVVRAFSDDAGSQLPQDAASLLRQTDAAYAQRMDMINNVLKPIMGPKGRPAPAETVAQRFNAMTRNQGGNSDAFSRFWPEINPEAQSDFVASYTSNLGVGRNGQFGLGKLATDIDSMSARARGLMYGDEGASSLGDISTLARAKSDTSGGLNNSRTAVALMRNVAAKAGPAALGGVVGYGMTGDPSGALLGAAALEGGNAALQLRAAKGLLNPTFVDDAVRASAPAMDDIATPYVQRGLLALSNRVTPEMTRLLETQVPLRAAAGEGDEDKKKKKRRP